ncbi:MAG TPA: ABC transporter substrate-binding protein [Candidatus Paceibacterota bacterium]|jgi:peptide/nickel transport system substrate-binding protein|nr:ABC transporter substrate-binding protein [Candidatus Paceibacterota bacterium]
MVDPDSETSASWKEKLRAERRLPYLVRFEDLLPRFSPAERLALYVLSALLAISALVLVIEVSHDFSTVVPARGGSLTEGEIGPARFINPLLTVSQVDQDLTQLVYSGLLRANADGSYSPDLAESYSISPDGTVYTFKLRPDAKFSDGTPVTSADVVFTVQLAQNPAIKSPQEADWEGVQVSAPDSGEVVFTLPHPYAPFLQNATLGILPRELWQGVSAEEFPFSPLNTNPVGSGPYKVASFKTDSTGSPTRYDLVPNANFALGDPLLGRITFLFYPDGPTLIKALNAGQIDAMAGVSPSDLPNIRASGEEILQVPLPRVFGVFFNQSHNPVLADPVVRTALNEAVDKQTIVNDVLGGYGVPLNSPIPPGVLGQAPQVTVSMPPFGVTASSSPVVAQNTQTAQATLQRGGWTFDQTNNVWTKGSGKKKQTLALALSTADQPELVATADAVAAAWQAAGVQVSVQVYPLSDFNNTILRPRSYDAILFGQVVGRTTDLFAFWDSTQRNDPGLNLAMYASSKADPLLSQARATSDQATRDGLYQQFAQIVQQDQPAVFLYAPDLLYVVPQNLEGIELGALTGPSDRFMNVYQWYDQTTRIWDALAPSAVTR